MNRILLPIIGLLFCAGSANAQQFVAVKVEAENFVTKHSDWRLTSNSNTPNVNPDPDGSHASSASGRAYMELLPDTRVTHSDQLVSGGNFWNTAGTGPSLSYNVNIPEAGRYIVFVKAYSTGTEDNGIHVGLNGSNPASGQRMQWCSGKNKWTWGSAQRVDSNHCGTERTIYLDFSFAGSNTVTFSAREDGFEMDQFILLKTSNSTCAPNDSDQIACNTGTSNIDSQTTTPTTPSQPTTPVPAPEPVLATPAVEVTPEPVVQTASVQTTETPICASAASDPDGDGYGWENNASCLAAPTVATESITQQQSVASEFAVCQNSASDADGDGFGWEQNASCVVNGSSASTTVSSTATAEEVVCESSASDPDGDGWGWENSQSCRVQ